MEAIKMKNILLVEDNESYAKAAETYLTSMDYTVTGARDYTEAMAKLDSSIDGVITDLFFPETTGSGNVDLGRRLVERITEGYRKPEVEERVSKGLKTISQEIGLGNPKIRKYVGYLLRTSEDPVLQDIINLCRIGRQEWAVAMIKSIPEDMIPRYGYLDLMDAMEESEANQPLGVLVAENAYELGKPCVVTTSTYHHGRLTSPIFNAARDGKLTLGGKYRLTLLDAAPGHEAAKADPRFWAQTVEELEKMNKFRVFKEEI